MTQFEVNVPKLRKYIASLFLHKCSAAHQQIELRQADVSYNSRISRDLIFGFMNSSNKISVTTLKTLKKIAEN